MRKCTPVKDDKQCFNCVYYNKGYCKIRAIIVAPKSFHHCNFHRIKAKEKTK